MYKTYQELAEWWGCRQYLSTLNFICCELGRQHKRSCMWLALSLYCLTNPLKSHLSVVLSEVFAPFVLMWEKQIQARPIEIQKERLGVNMHLSMM